MLSVYDNFRLITYNIVNHFDKKKETGFYEMNDINLEEIVEKYKSDKTFRNEFISLLEKTKNFKKTTRHNIKDNMDNSAIGFIKSNGELYIVAKVSNYRAHYLNQVLYLYQQLYKIFVNIEYVSEMHTNKFDLFILLKIKEKDKSLIDFSIVDITKLIFDENSHINKGI